MDSLDEDIQRLKDDIKRLDARAEHYATQQQLDVVAQLGRDNQERLNVIEGQIDDLEGLWGADRDALEARIVAIEEQRSGTGGTGGGKRRKRKTKKRRKKKTKKRRKKRRRKKRTKRRK